MAHRFIWLAAICAYALATTGAIAAEQGHRYLTPMITYIDDDAKRQIDDQLGGFQLGYGQAVAPLWDLEIAIFQGGWDGFDKSDQYGVALDGHLLFNEDRAAAFSPYLVFGTGLMNTLRTRAPDASGSIMAVGVGADFRLKPGVAFRADARIRRDFSPSGANLDDLVLNLGFRVGLGETPAARAADSDGDGVGDDVDRCPGTPAGVAVDSSGCELDGDRDGVADRLDQCPDTRRGASVDARGCEIVRDGDGDGVPDRSDRCPNSPAGARVDANGCEFDSDADGVVDRLDRCPATPAGTRVDARGCPLQQEIRLEGVFFETNSAQLRDDAVQRLNQAVQTLKLNSDLRVEVAGYTDSSGAASYNQQLSQRRAEAVRDYLVSKGIAGGRLSARGYGEEKPVASNETREGRAQNRRVVLRVLDEEM